MVYWDYGVLATEPILVPQPLEDPLRRVALLPGNAQVRLQDPVDDADEGLQLGPLGRYLPPVARRDRIGQHFAHGVPVHAKLSGDLPNTHPLHHHRPANPQIYVHSVHPSHHP